MNAMQEKQWEEFNKLSSQLLEEIVPVIEQYSNATVCYSFLMYLAVCCNNPFGLKILEGAVDRNGKKFSNSLDFFHSQLDLMYEIIKSRDKENG